jgi:4-amino-4-deoxy-L-arabinose transferase-like glycosyltransferase
LDKIAIIFAKNPLMPKIPFWIFILIALLHLSAIRVDIMDIDASQYAEISREMMHSGDYLHIYDRCNEYLDKPPFLFWASSLGMQLFGLNNFGYKFGSILFALWAIYATYRLAKLLYGEATGRMAALILGTCQGMFLMTNDIRTDTILMSCVITAIWMIKEAEIKRRWWNVLGGCLAIACGMMTKGPIALLVPGFCFGTDWLLKRNWKQIFSLHHILDLTLVAIFLVPMSIGLYEQFDMHPEKTVNGLTNVSGLRFFFWSQSFGRITGESPWNNGAGFDFLMLNMLWSFLPWIFLFIPALIINIVSLFKQKFRLHPGQEWISTGGFLLAYIALGSSKYQLPHYIFVVFPLAAIITAKFINELFENESYKKAYRFFKPFQLSVSALLLVAALLTLVFVFSAGPVGIVLWSLLAIAWIVLISRKQLHHKLFWGPVAAIIIANIFLTHHFYYTLMNYQVGSQIGKYIAANNIPSKDVIPYKVPDPLTAMHFYADAVINNDTSEITHGKYVLTVEDGKTFLQQEGYTFDVLKEDVFFKVSELTPNFLNPATRHKATTKYYFLKLK